MNTIVVIRKNGRTVQRRDIHAVSVPKVFSEQVFTCSCAQTFELKEDFTRHLRWAERRPHEKHRRVR